MNSFLEIHQQSVSGEFSSMIPFNDPEAESLRLDILSKLEILDSPSELIYDDAAKLAARLCNVPMAAVSLVGKDRQWFKARVGIPLCETDRRFSFCSHAICQPGPFIVADPMSDERFSSHPLVVGDGPLRFYAGVPIYAANVAIGTVCVIDTKPRTLSAFELELLEALARQLSALLQLRLETIEKRKREAALTGALELAEENRRLSDYSAKRFQSLFDGMPVPGLTIDLSGGVMEWNEASQALFGFTSSEIFGRKFFDAIVPEEFRTAAIDWLKETIEAGGGTEVEEANLCSKSGQKLIALVRTLPLYSPSGELVGIICATVDITERKRSEALLSESHQLIQDQRDELARANSKLEILASTDGLTGLRNRRSFQDYFEIVLAAAIRYGHPLSVILVDVDNFKSLNDHYGHAEGDSVLRHVAQIIKSNARECDFAGRYGGEEFILVLQETSSHGATAVAERIRSAIEGAKWLDIPVTASFGVSGFVHGIDTRESLVERADQALYKAKRGGRNLVVAV